MISLRRKMSARLVGPALVGLLVAIVCVAVEADEAFVPRSASVDMIQMTGLGSPAAPSGSAGFTPRSASVDVIQMTGLGSPAAPSGSAGFQPRSASVDVIQMTGLGSPAAPSGSTGFQPRSASVNIIQMTGLGSPAAPGTVDQHPTSRALPARVGNVSDQPIRIRAAAIRMTGDDASVVRPGLVRPVVVGTPDRSAPGARVESDTPARAVESAPRRAPARR